MNKLFNLCLVAVVCVAYSLIFQSHLSSAHVSSRFCPLASICITIRNVFVIEKYHSDNQLCIPFCCPRYTFTNSMRCLAFFSHQIVMQCFLNMLKLLDFVHVEFCKSIHGHITSIRIILNLVGILNGIIMNIPLFGWFSDEILF